MKTTLLLPAIVALSGLGHASVLVTPASLSEAAEDPPQCFTGDWTCHGGLRFGYAHAGRDRQL